MTKWMQAANKRMEAKGTKGSLTKAAHRAGYPNALAYAHHLVSQKNASPAMLKKAHFAINANK